MLELGPSSLVEWTKAGGQTSRRVDVGAGAGGLFVDGNVAWVVARGVLHRIDLTTFQGTKRTVRGGEGTSVGASILGKRGDVLVLTFADGKRAALVAVDTTKPDQDPVTLKTPAFAGTKSTGTSTVTSRCSAEIGPSRRRSPNGGLPST